jgi:hypothetical protein
VEVYNIPMHLRRVVGKLLVGCAILGAFGAFGDEEITEETARQFIERFRTGAPVPANAQLVSAQASPEDQAKEMSLRVPETLPDLLSIAPGLVVLRQAPGADADSYLWRGISAYQGAGVASYVDDVPLNLPGFRVHGSADLHWVIPELVERVDGLPGPYLAAFGDYDAGVLRLTTRRQLPKSAVEVSTGMNSTLRGLVISSSPHSSWLPLLAGEYFSSSAPSPSPDGLKRYNLFGKVTKALDARSQLALSLTAYRTDWTQAGLVSARALDAGQLPWRGTSTPDQDGTLARYGVTAGYRNEISKEALLTITAFGSRSAAVSNGESSLFAKDIPPQSLLNVEESNTRAGMVGRYRYAQRSPEIGYETELGMESALDWGEATRHLAVDNIAISAPIRDRLAVQKVGVYASQGFTWGSWAQTTAGIRGDLVRAGANDEMRQALLASPKAGLSILPDANLQLFVNMGASYRSNDPRARANNLNIISRATGYEFGARTQLLAKSLHINLAAFSMNEQASASYDEGTTYLTPANSRQGVQVQARYDLTSWLVADADMTVSRSRLNDSSLGAAVPFAPTRTVIAGLTARHPRGYYGRLSLLNVGDRPANTDGSLTADGFSRMDVSVGYRTNDFQLSTGVLNITGARWRETQIAGASRLDGQPDVLVTPGYPFTVQASASVFF